MSEPGAFGIVAYASYLPSYRLSPRDIGGRADRVVASFDEDSTTMGVSALASALATGREAGVEDPRSVYFATTTPAYADKTNAVAIHAALGLDRSAFAVDLAGSGRSAVAALHLAESTGGAAVFADVRVGLPGSGDERGGGDGAAAFVFGPGERSIVDVLAHACVTAEFLDRWRSTHSATGERWEERFGFEQYSPLILEAARRALAGAGIERADHVVLACPNPAVIKKATKLVPGAVSTTTSVLGFSGAADAGVALAAVLDTAAPEQTILLLSAVDGCDATVLRTTVRLPDARQSVPVATQRAGGSLVSYPTYLSWRGLLHREPPRRPEPERPAAPPSGRSSHWKFALQGTRCENCGFAHLPPARVCRECGAVDQMRVEHFGDRTGVVATFTVDHLAYSPSPPVVGAVVDFDGGGRYTLEVADGGADTIAVGLPVSLTFRRLFTAGGVHNYFWKARLIDAAGTGQGEYALAGNRASQ